VNMLHSASTSFFVKKQQKNFCSAPRGVETSIGPDSQKFFGYFFSKK